MQCNIMSAKIINVLALNTMQYKQGCANMNRGYRLMELSWLGMAELLGQPMKQIYINLYL